LLSMSYSHEDIVSDVEQLNDNDVMVLSIVDVSPAKITRIQKLGLFIEKLLDVDPDCSHGAYNYGAYSDDLDVAASSMKLDGAVTLKDGNYELTSYGSSLLTELKNDPKKKEFVEGIASIVSFFDSLNDHQLLKLSYIVYPETTGQSLIKDTMVLDRKSYTIGDLDVKTNLTKEQLEDMLIHKLEDD
ncbi:MAG: hypothetical protein J5614_02835, partial [Paludibacteraceae bacterium]|nr:hypothetical protein [Paludibacteraceae bacterium]